MKRYLISFIPYSIAALSLLIALVSPCLGQEKVIVSQFGKEKFLLYLPLYIAMEENYFQENGIDIKLVFAGNDDQVFATVAGGSADFGVGDPVFTAIAQERGFRAKTVAMLIRKLGNTGYTNKPDIDFVKKPEELANLRIGSLPKPSTTFTLLDEIKRNYKEQLKNTQIVQAGMGGQLALLESGQVDIAIDLEPAVSRLEAKGYRVVFNLNEHIDPQVITGLMTTEDTISRRPKVVQAMVNGLEKALTTLTHSPEIGVSVARKLFPELSPEIIDRAVKRMISKGVYPESTVIMDSYWQRTLKTRLDSGQLKHDQTLETSVDNTFATQARTQFRPAIATLSSVDAAN